MPLLTFFFFFPGIYYRAVFRSHTRY